MIYRVVLDGTTDIHTADIDNMLLDPSIELEMNSAGSFTFTLPPTHPAWDLVTVFKSTIDVYEGTDLIFTGRVANIDKNWNNERVIECEGALAYFNDTVYRQNKWEDPLILASDPEQYPDEHTFLGDILANHNVHVPSNRQIFMGHCTIERTYVTREVDYDTTLDILTRMCIDTNGGWFQLRKGEDGKLYLDWLKDLTNETEQPVQFGLNLLDFSSGLHAEDICTGVIARGATVDDKVVMLDDVELIDESTYPDMSVTHYADHDQDILWHREGVSIYGQVVQVHDFSDAQTAWKDQSGTIVENSLLEEARKWLENKNKDVETIEVEAVELSWIGDGYPAFRLGMLVQLSDTVHMGTESRKLPMYKISLNLNDGAKKITLGTPPKKELTQISASNSSSSTLGTGGSASGGSGGSGGSGEECKVRDVLVNGSSVVSEKIARIAVPTDTVTSSQLAEAVAPKANTVDVTNALNLKQDTLTPGTGISIDANNVISATGGGGGSSVSYGAGEPSDGSDGDLYMQLEAGDFNVDVFGSPNDYTTENAEITGNTSIYQTYYPYLAFGDGKGFGRVGGGEAILTYTFTDDSKFKIKHISFYDNFTVSSGYLQSSSTIFEGSCDGVNWDVIFTKSGYESRDVLYETDITSDVYYSHFRFRINNSTGGYTGIKGIVFIGVEEGGYSSIIKPWLNADGNWLTTKDLSDKTLMMSNYYSEDEQVVGRWTDGKPLYQKTAFVTLPTGNYNGWFSHNISGLTNAEIKHFDYDIYFPEPSIGKNGYNDGNYKYEMLRVTNDQIYFIGNGWTTGNFIANLTLQYTKTTDAPGTGPTKGNLIYLPALYSEEEREIGVWIDGKPLYQKTAIFNSLTKNSWNTMTHGVSNIEKVVYCFGGCNQYTSQDSFYSVGDNNSYNMLVSASQTDVSIYVGNFNFPKAIVTFQYTKTTDQPGSGTWTPEGQLAHHYSTSEHIVGTWIDGSTVYERTFDLGSDIQFPYNTWTNTNISANGMEKVVNTINAIDSTGTNMDISVAVGGSYIQINHWRSGSLAFRYLTIQYTKTT